jgi:hypothetical protein
MSAIRNIINNGLAISVESLIASLLTPVFSWAACAGSSPIWNTTADYASVSSCVSQASPGDTINVVAGGDAAGPFTYIALWRGQ